MLDPGVLCRPTVSILEAMERLNALPAPKYILVIDESRRLLGTVTDGDIRRAILRGVQLSSPVTSCMNASPIVAPSDQRRQASRLLKDNGVTFVPLLDRMSVVVDVVTQILTRPVDVAVVLMAGGLGTRLRHRTANTPKPLLQIAGKPILQRIVERVEASGFRTIYIAVNYLAEQIIEFFETFPPKQANIHFLRESKRLGTAGPLSLLPTRPHGPILVANADLITETDFEAFLQFHSDHGYEATVGAALHMVDIPYGVIDCDQDGLIRSIKEKPRVDYLVNAGIYLLNPAVWDLIPSDIYIDMPEVLSRAMECGQKIGAFPIHEYWIDIGRQRELAQAERDWSEDVPAE